jgi:hypothetical protein
MFLLLFLFLAVARADGDEWLPWKIIWDITPATPSWQVADTVTVNSVLHTDAHVKIRVPTFNESTEQVATFKVLANATTLPSNENMTVRATVGDPKNAVVLEAFAVGHQLQWSQAAAPVRAGDWIFLNVSSSISTFYGFAVDVAVQFDSVPSRFGHGSTSTCERPRRNIGLVIGLSVGGALFFVGLCVAACAAIRRRRRMRVAAAGIPMPPSGEPGVFLPPAYRR